MVIFWIIAGIIVLCAAFVVVAAVVAAIIIGCVSKKDNKEPKVNSEENIV